MSIKKGLAVVFAVCMLCTSTAWGAEGLRAEVLTGVPKKTVEALPNGYHFTEIFDKNGIFYSYYENEKGERHLLSSEDTVNWQLVETPGGTAYVNEKGHYMAMSEEAGDLAVYVSTTKGTVWNKVSLSVLGELDSPLRLTSAIGNDFILETDTERFASTSGSSWSKLNMPKETPIYYAGGYYFTNPNYNTNPGSGWLKSTRLVGTTGDWSPAFTGITGEVLAIGYDHSAAEYIVSTEGASFRSTDLKTWRTVSNTIQFIQGRPVRDYNLSGINITALMENRYDYFTGYTLRTGEVAVVAENNWMVGIQSVYYYEGHGEDVQISELSEFVGASNARIDNIIYVSKDYGLSWTAHVAQLNVKTIYGTVYYAPQKVQVYVQGARLPLSTAAIYHNQTIMLPLKEISSALGASVSETDGVIVITYGGDTATFTVGRKVAIVDRKERTMKEGMIPRGDDYLVQADVLMQLFGYRMGYNNTARTLDLIK